MRSGSLVLSTSESAALYKSIHALLVGYVELSLFMIPRRKPCSITMRAFLLVGSRPRADRGDGQTIYEENGAGVRVERSQTRPTLTHACPTGAVPFIRGLPPLK